MTGNIEIQQLNIGYSKNKELLATPFTYKYYQGNLTAIVGANGVGKSTFLKTLAGIIKPIRGSISIGNFDISKLNPLSRAKYVSYIGSQTNYMPDIPAIEIVQMGRFTHTGWIKGLSSADKSICVNAMKTTDVYELKDRIFTTLSDGEKQRVLIAMALSQNAPVLLLDEPTAFLDIPNRIKTFDILKNLAVNNNKTVIFSTHDISKATYVCDCLTVFYENNIVANKPEILGIKGFYDKLFLSNDISFKIGKNDFYKNDYNKTGVTVAVNGDENLVFWTKMALDKNGFRTDCNLSASISVLVSEKNNVTSWILSKNNTDVFCNSFEELLLEILKIKN